MKNKLNWQSNEVLLTIIALLLLALINGVDDSISKKQENEIIDSVFIQQIKVRKTDQEVKTLP